MLETGDGRLSHSHPGCELRARHSQGIPDRPDPAVVRWRFVGGEPKPVETGVEVPPGACTSFAHLGNLSATADKHTGQLSPGADNFPELKIRHRIGSESSVADVGPFPPMLAGRDSRASAEGWTDHRDDVRPSEAHRFANDGAGRRLDQDEERIAHDPIPGPSVVAHDHRDTANPECCLTDLAWGHGLGPLGDNYCRNRCRQLATVVAEASPELVATVAVDVEKCQQQRLGVLPDDDPDRVTRRGSPCEIRSRRGLGSSGTRGDRSEPGHERRVRKRVTGLSIGVGSRRSRFAFYPGADAPSSITSTPLPLPHHRHDTSSTDSSRTSTSSTVRSPPTEK